MRGLFGRQRTYLALFLLPGLIYVAAWRIAPALVTVYLSFTSFNLAFDPGPTWAGIANYAQVAADTKLRASLLVTLQFALVAVVVELALGLGIAILLDRRLPLRNVVLGVTLVPMVLAPVAVATIWYVLLHRYVGPVPFLLRWTTGLDVDWISTKAMALAGIVIADVWQWTPLVVLLLLAALQGVARDTVEAALVDGASGAQVLRFITLPQISGMIAVAAGLRFADAFLELDKVIVMTGGGPGTSTELVAVHVLRTAFQFFTLGYAASIVVSLLIVLALLYQLFLRTLPGGGLRPATDAEAVEPR